jgi:oxygen-independent coproporphyrinogen-3 oxidase
LYLKTAGSAAALSEDRVVATHEVAFEFMLNALRLREGFEVADFAERTGQALDQQPGFGLGLSRGLLEQQGSRVRTSDLGYRFLNDTVACFLNDAAMLR